jgi:thioredoxin reductase (NADPH)
MLGVFVFAGYEPETGWISDSGCGVELDESGYIVTDANRKTTVDGIYAAGDVCIKNLRQVVTAVSDGAVAATEAEKHAAAMHEKLGLPQFEVRAVNRPAAVPVEAPKEEKASAEQGGSFITDQIRAQLVPLFDKFSSTVTIKGEINRTSFGREIASFIGEFKGMSPNVLTRIEEIATDSDSQNVPVIKILNSAGEETGLEFHAVPGGHEFNSFIIGLYNVAGPGQKIDDEDLAGISKIISEKNVRIFVSLSCTMCPETVMSAQKIATMSNRVSVKVYDLQHFPDLKEKYQIMSVPCIVINDESPQFGKKNISQFLDLLTK